MEALDFDLKLLSADEAGGIKSRVQAEKPGARRFVQSVGFKIERSQGNI